MYITEHRTIFFWIVGVISAVALGSVLFFGIKTGIDFTGGNLTEVRYDGTRPDVEAVHAQLVQAGIDDVSVRATGDAGLMIRTESLSAEKQAAFRALIAPEGGAAHIDRMTDIGPTVGTELYRKSLVAIVLVALSILIYLAFAFRTPAPEAGKKPLPVDDVSSWWYGLIAIVTLLHDILIPVGMIAIMGHYAGAAVDTLFITALLTILGYSVNDTIVIFDRVREKVRTQAGAKHKEPFAHVVGTALTETYGRSINTSLTALLSLIALYLFGPATTHLFALTMIAGVVAGTYSSILLAAPLLIVVYQYTKKA